MAGRRPSSRSLGGRELKLRLLFIGRCRDRRILELCEDYLKRINRHVSASVTEVTGKDHRTLAAKIARAAGEARVVALAEDGRLMDSPAFARHLAKLLAGPRNLVFVVGGAGGYPEQVESLVHERLSLSPMTMPHRLARVFLLEQVYRALSIIHREPYHK